MSTGDMLLMAADRLDELRLRLMRLRACTDMSSKAVGKYAGEVTGQTIRNFEQGRTDLTTKQQGLLWNLVEGKENWIESLPDNDPDRETAAERGYFTEPLESFRAVDELELLLFR